MNEKEFLKKYKKGVTFQIPYRVWVNNKGIESISVDIDSLNEDFTILINELEGLK